MLIYIGEISDEYYYGVYNIIKMLYPESEITRYEKENSDLKFEFEISDSFVTVFQNEKKITKRIALSDISLTIKQCIYELSGKKLPFGVFTGIRPAKVIMRNKDSGEIFRNMFYADPKKVEVAVKCAEYEKKLIKDIKKGGIALYVHIPFCPTRCSYCSFTAVSFNEKLMDEYFEALFFELKEVIKSIKENGYNLLCVYVGGGTPTVLSSEKLNMLLSEIRKNFPDVSEFTVEAGRPDTVTEEKLDVLKQNGVTRISINPQTLNDKTLAEIGRNHTAEDFFRACDIALKKNFFQINTDIIAGLKNESLNDFKYTLDNILKISPESITVHTLCSKRCAVKKENSENPDTGKMIDYTYENLNGIYEPYYIYRQKNAAGALENTGFVKDGRICAYNIIMMEEIASVIAVGAGSASKLIDFESKKPFLKLRSDKQPQRYISEIQNIVFEKRRFLENGKERI